ncbi:hypothetical protein CTAYLR_010175 [Chrysophaeum taylorii]|uniref:Uncharacterized protein n=1 Tax=Chrysophaeum taylorii TaxID=2483200 RepID=A0AAD7UM16_9STRA|nr:hypothetical protein CTAYLR_010175 [Chrysophaeum taylorii]
MTPPWISLPGTAGGYGSRHIRVKVLSHYDGSSASSFGRHLLAWGEFADDDAAFDFELDTSCGNSVARADTFSFAGPNGPTERVPVGHANALAHRSAVCCADSSTNTAAERDPFEHSLADSQRDTVHATDLDAVPPPHRDSIDGPIPRANFGSFCEPDVDSDD